MKTKSSVALRPLNVLMRRVLLNQAPHLRARADAASIDQTPHLHTRADAASIDQTPHLRARADEASITEPGSTPSRSC